jgi:hypothetical protein
MNTYEKLGAFYLGKEFDMAAQQLKDDLVLYDAKDLNTHAVIIGMTGSGKTGLGISLLEEALIDNIPVIAIDPKGDLPNLLLNFPQLQPGDFRPWINAQDALNAGQTPDQFAAKQADLWKKGLAGWQQQPERIARLQACADMAVYTPGSNAGLPVSVLRKFAPPTADTMAEKDLLRERIQSTVTALLALLDIEADPITSREHILVSNIIETSWAAGHGPDLAGLIRAIQSPPFERIGVMDLEMFYPPKDRFQLAMVAMLEDGPVGLDWDQAEEIKLAPDDLETEPLAATRYADLPATAKKAKKHAKWNKDFSRWIRQNRPLRIYRSNRFKLSSDPHETKADFLARLAQAAREKRDLEIAKLRRKYNSKFNTLNNRLIRAEQAVMREKEQSQASKFQSAISFGTAILGAFMGRKAVSVRSARSFGTAMRSASRIRKESMDVDRARERMEATKAELQELDELLQEDIERIEATFDPQDETIEEVQIKPKSTDMTLEFFGLVWMPYRRDARGQLSPDWA